MEHKALHSILDVHVKWASGNHNCWYCGRPVRSSSHRVIHVKRIKGNRIKFNHVCADCIPQFTKDYVEYTKRKQEDITVMLGKLRLDALYGNAK